MFVCPILYKFQSKREVLTNNKKYYVLLAFPCTGPAHMEAVNVASATLDPKKAETYNGLVVLLGAEAGRARDVR